jgi:Possible hemagglutinin (DUF637)/Pre-toxin domain with VENN motif
LIAQAHHKLSSKPAFHPTVAANSAARFAATITLEGVKTTVQTAQTSESNYVVWQKLQGAGSTTQTFALPSFVGGVKFNAPGGLTVQIPQGSALQTQLQTLAAQPGMAYLNDIAARSDVNWQPVKLAFDQWSYQKEGLTPAGAAILAVAVAWATGLPPTTGVLDAVQYAGALSIRTQAVITLVNNKGNLGKTLSDLASSNTVKAALTAMMTAGVLNQVAAMPGMQSLKASLTAADASFVDKLTYNLINATGRALTSATINGGTLADALNAAVVGGLVDTAQGEVSSKIKLIENDRILHKLAHALSGCVAGALGGGNCQDGAIGAAVGEMVAELYKGNKPLATAPQAEWDAYNNKVLSVSKLVAGGLSAYTGGNAQTAITTAEVAVRNNALKNISRPLNGLLGLLVDHRATVVERDRADQFSADIRRDLGEPVLLPDGKYGYVLESLRSKNDQYLYPVANDKSVGGSLDSWTKNSYTLYRTDKDNYPSEDALLRVYASDIKEARTRTYPTNSASLGCYIDFCGANFYNSNTDADIRLLRSFISPPNTGTSNVPGGLADRERNPLRAMFNSLLNLGAKP